MPYNIQAMLSDGHTPEAIADALVKAGEVPQIAGQSAYDYTRMKEAGYGDKDIALAIINKTPQKVSPGEREGLTTQGIKSYAQGALGTFMPGNMVETVNHLFGMPDRGTMFPTTEDAGKFIREKTGINIAPPTPHTEEEKFVQSGAGLAGAVMPFGRPNPWGLVRRSAGGLTAGVIGQGSENAFPGSKGYAEVLAMLLTPEFRTPNAVKAVRSAMGELTPAELAAAQQRVNQAAGQFGVRGPIAQGFDRPTQLEGIHNAIVASPEGGQLASALARQLTAATDRSRGLVDDLTRAPISGAEANRVAGVGDRAVDAPSRERTQATAQAYADAGNTQLPPFAITFLNHLLEQRRGQGNPPGSIGGDVYTNIQRDLSSLPVPTNPVAANAFLREQGSQAFTTSRNPAASANEVARMRAQSDVSRSGKEILRAISPEFEAAERAYQARSGPVNTMETSRLPHYFGREAAQGRGDFDAYAKMLNEHPDQIRFMARNLEQSDITGQAFPQIVKAAWEQKLSSAFKSSTGRPPNMAPGKFATDIAGTSGTPERAAFRTTMEEVGRVHGANPQQYADAAETLADALHTASRGRQALGKVNQNELERRAGANIVSGALRTPGFLVGASPWSSALERIIGDRTFARISDAFLSPDAITRLMQIRNYSAMRNAANIVARDLLSVQSASSVYSEPEKAPQ